jgi:uncharacterized membrane protein YfcA
VNEQVKAKSDKIEIMNLFFFLIIISFACFYQGLTGFGSALIAAPLLLLILDKVTVVTSITLVGLVLNVFLLRKIKQPLNLTLLLPLCLASVIGMPFGIWILKAVPINLMKIIAGSLAILSALIISFTKSSLPRTKLLTVIAGIFSGVLQTSISMSGPPVVTLLAAMDGEKNEMRKTLVTFFLFINLVSLPFFLFSKFLTFQRISLSCFVLPFVFLGAYLGNKVVEKIPQKAFRWLALVTVCITGLVSIYSGLS